MSELLLFEPFLWNDIVDYPDLGAATLVSACRHANVSVELFVTQKEIIRNLFCFSSKEIKDLLRDLSSPMKGKYPLLVQHYDDLNTYLQSIYNRYYSKRWEEYFNAELTKLMQMLFRELIDLQSYWYLECCRDIPILSLLRETINNSCAKVIGFSAYDCTPLTIKLCKDCKCVTNKVIILGGAFTGHLAENDMTRLFEERIADYLILGQGEVALPKIVKLCLDSDDVDTFPENVVKLWDRPCCKYDTLKKIPLRALGKYNLPDYTLSNVDDYPCPVVILPLQTARGCTWRRCEFCSHHNGYYGEYHAWNIPDIVDHMEIMMNQFCCRNFVFHDDDIPAKRLQQIAREIRMRKLNVNVFAYVRPTKEFLDISFEELVSAGIVAYSWGVESGAQEVLDSIKKGTNVIDIYEILSRSAQAGGCNVCWIMINLPDESKKAFDKTLIMMGELRNCVDLWMISPFRLQYDSPMYEKSREKTDANVRGAFEFSAVPQEAQMKAERQKTHIINLLYNTNAFSNSSYPCGFLPLSSQRARLLPFIYRNYVVTSPNKEDTPILLFDTIEGYDTMDEIMIKPMYGERSYLFSREKYTKIQEAIYEFRGKQDDEVRTWLIENHIVVYVRDKQ